jgi:hypothetical protein
MEGEVLPDSIRGDPRWRRRWRQGEVEDDVLVHWGIMF